MKAGADLAQRLSDACVKTTLVLMGLSASAVGVAEKFQAAKPFEAYARYETARTTLESLVVDLARDGCWLSFTKTLSEHQLPETTTLGELKAIECTPTHDKMRVNLAIRDHPVPSKIDPGSLLFIAPRPSLPSGTEKWYGLGAAEIIEHTLSPLWDDELLIEGGLYSAVAQDEIYRWQLYRYRLQQRRGLPLVPERLTPGGAIAESNFLRLTVGDLNDLSQISHPLLSELDRALQKNFHTVLPNSPLEVGVATAAQTVAFGAAIFTAILAAYVLSAVRAEALSSPGTVFHSLLGSECFELVGIIVLLIPGESLFILGNTIGWTSTNGMVIGGCEVVVLWFTGTIVWHIRKHMDLWRNFRCKRG